MENFTSKSGESIVEQLKNVPLLAKLKEAECELLAKKLTSKSFQKDANIVKQGDDGDEFFIIQSGTVKVTRTKDGGGEESHLATLKRGDFFGEHALVSECKRGATVTANDAVMAFTLSRKDFNDIFAADKLNITFAKRKAVSAERTTQTTYTPSIPADAVKDKTDEMRSFILNAVKFNVLFMNLGSDHQKKVIDEMYKIEIKQGQDAIVQGSLGDNFYVVAEGEFHVLVNGTRVAIRQSGTCFGELALMYNSPRAATVTAAADSVVWVVDRFTFRRCVTGVTEKTLKNYTNFLRMVPVLAPLAEYEREKVAEAMEEVAYEPNVVVCRQGEAGDSMFIVKEGELVVSKSENDAEAKEVSRCKVGDYFGERALVKNEARAATVTTVKKCSLLRIERNAFSLLLGPLEDIMMHKIKRYEDVQPKNDDAKANEALSECNIKFDDLEVLGTLGKGSFGHVQLVKDKNTGSVYALKAVSKAQIVQTGQQGHIMSEKRAMAALRHNFLVRLYQTYKDQDRLYFLLEPSLGGELFSVLREKTLFDEDTSRFYGGHVVLAFEYMHSLNYVYRDLKPENLLLDGEGYLKVTDFGFAKDVSGGRTWTLCGTPDYLAPEIVAGKGHSKGVDWWTLGVFIYEMLASYPPFYDEDPMKTYAKIMHGSITFPSHFSKEAVSIVKKLLYHKPTKRLGVVKGGAKLIKKHAWFKDFSWENLLDKKMKAPFVPNIKSNTDISNFDDYGDEDDTIQPYTDDGSNWEKDF